MRRGLSIIILLLIILGIGLAVRAIPEGAQVTIGAPQTRTPPTPGNVTAAGGNITEVNISVSSQTLAWQGFFGEVNGSIVLEDASGDLFFSWNITNISGEIYASRDNAVNFALIAPNNNCSVDNILTGFDKSDSVNNTFTPNNNRFMQVGLVAINASTACATHTYVNSSPQSTFFNVIILTDDLNANTSTNLSDPDVGGNTTVYATPIDANIEGFDTVQHDYQLLVPVNRTTEITVYFFYGELS